MLNNFTENILIDIETFQDDNISVHDSTIYFLCSSRSQLDWKYHPCTSTGQHHQFSFRYGRRWDSNLKYFFVWALIKNVYQQWKCPRNFRSVPKRPVQRPSPRALTHIRTCFPASRIAVSARIKTNNYKSHVIPNDIENEWPLGAILNRREEGRVPYQLNH